MSLLGWDFLQLQPGYKVMVVDIVKLMQIVKQDTYILDITGSVWKWSFQKFEQNLHWT